MTEERDTHDSQEMNTERERQTSSEAKPRNERVEEVREAVLTSAKDVIARALPLLKNPRATWPEIEAETESILEFYQNYLFSLIAIRPVCLFLGYGIVNRYLGATFIGSFMAMVAVFAVGLVLPYLAALICQKVASLCEGEMSVEAGLRLTGYSLTPLYFAGLFELIPAFKILTIFAAVYAGYLYYLGTPVLAGIPKENIVKFVSITLVAFVGMKLLLEITATLLTLGTVPF